MMPRFDEGSITRAASSMPWRAALAFGTACASRIVPNYTRFNRETHWGTPGDLREALEHLWQIASGQLEPEPKTCQTLLERLEAQAPDSEEFDSLYTSSAQDSVFALCALLDFCLDRKRPEHVTLAARYPTDSVDLYVQEQAQMDPQAKDLEQRILASPLMQQELERQARDLRLLQTGPLDAAVAQLRARSGFEDAFEVGAPG